MVQNSPLTTCASPWTDPEVLSDLLDYLRGQGYKVTPSEYALVQDLLLALIAHGEDISDVGSLRAYLAPVLCTSPKEQSNFSGHFDRWVKQNLSVVNPQSEPQPQPENELEIAKNRRWISFLITITACVIAALFVIFLSRRDPQRTPVPVVLAHETKPSPGDTSISWAVVQLATLYAGLVAMLIALAWFIWWYLRGRLFLKRRPTDEALDIVSVALDSRSGEWLDQALLGRTAREMRRRYPTISSELAIASTVEQTIYNNGQFTPVFSSTLVSPEYLVLIDRRSFRDHYSHYLDEIIARLKAEQVYIQRYYFDSDPRTLWPQDGCAPVTLRNIQTRYCDCRTLVFTDCSVFFNPVSGDVEAWTEMLWLWRSLAVFTPKPRGIWGYQENLLSRLCLILPASVGSIDDFARSIEGFHSPRVTVTSDINPLPWELVERPNRWLERDAPLPESVEEVLRSVRRFLGEDGYFWLSACAVYPELHFNITMYLGTNMKTATGEQLFTNERAFDLFRLPWFRYEYIPDWLRLQLVRDLTRQQNRTVREALHRLWLSAVGGSPKAIKLEVAHRNLSALTALTTAVFSRLLSHSASDGPLHDRVFASVMLGRNVDPLAVRIPRMWRKFLKKRNNTAQVSWIQKLANRYVAALITMFCGSVPLWAAGLLSKVGIPLWIPVGIVFVGMLVFFRWLCKSFDRSAS